MKYSMAALGFARQRGLGRLVAANELALPFASAAFDCVVAVEVLEHFEDDAALVLGDAGFQVLRCEFIKCLFFLPLLLCARTNRPIVHGKAAARDDFFARPRWLNELLRLEIVWEARLRLNRLAPFGVALLAVARRPGPERS